MGSRVGDRVLRAALSAAKGGHRTDRELLACFSEGDEAAFEAIVNRHTGMVLGVCRRVLPTIQDAEDACQAAFLVLSRKAKTGRWQSSIANWLYTIARRVAANAKRAAARRMKRESLRAPAGPVSPLDQMTAREGFAALDEELEKLPAIYREPLVLCYLQGLTRDEAAKRLGVPSATLKGQLDRGRKKLADALTKRGIVVGAGLLAVVTTSSARATSSKLVESILAGVGGSPSAAVAALAKRVAMNGLVSTARLIMLATVTATVVGFGFASMQFVAGQQEPSVKTSEKPADTSATEKGKKLEPVKNDKEAVTFAGRVLDPDGQPAVGAQIYVARKEDKANGAPSACAVTSETGRFRFSVPAADQEGRQLTAVFAIADGFGPAWIMIPAKAGEITLRLAKDDVPVKGRIVDLEGKPVPGVTIEVTAIKAPPDGSLTPWLEAVKNRPTADGISLENEYLPQFVAGELNSLFPKITTDKDGRFVLRAIGRERAATLLVEGPTIETREINILTRAGLSTITVPPWRQAPELWSDITYCSIGLDHPVAPCRPVSGVVRDKATGKPVAGATVRAQKGVGNPMRMFQTTTDSAGHYRLTGLPAERPKQGMDTLIVLSPSEGPAYLSRREQIGDGDRFKPATLDFELDRGVWVEGRVTDKVTGRGVAANLEYFVFSSDAPDADRNNLLLNQSTLPLKTDKQGRFRFVGMPNKGLLGARVWPNGEHFRIGVGADRIEGRETDETGIKGTRGMTFRTLPSPANAWNYDVLAEVKPTKGADKATCNLVLDPGRKQTVRVLGPDGKPVTGVQVAGQFARRFFGEPLEGAECTVYGLADREPRTVLFVHEGKKLSGLLELKGDEEGLIDITLQPSAAVSGRLLDDEGRPLRDADGSVHYWSEAGGKVLYNHSGKLLTDAEGRFRIGGLVPGIRYLAQVRIKGKRLPGTVFDDLSLKAGETKDLGEVKVKTMEE